MIIEEVIQRVKGCCKNIDMSSGQPIDDVTTRDQVTYGSVDQECTGIVTCIWPTTEIVRRAQELGANLIVTHEALFWNHGDHQDVVSGNKAYQAKKELLDAWGGAVWRCHDYIHATLPLGDGGSYVDGIFYGVAKKLGWEPYLVGDTVRCMDYAIPATTGREVAAHVVSSLGLHGTRLIGDPDATVTRVRIPMHVMGHGVADTDILNSMDAEDIDCLLTMEFIDFTVCEYVRDAAMLGQGKCAVAVGHFNLEEPGMELMAEWLPETLGADAPPVTFVPMGDTYRYVLA